MRLEVNTEPRARVVSLTSELGTPMSDICFVSDGRTAIAPLVLSAGGGKVSMERADSIQLARRYRRASLAGS